jgi:hypothetical protein
VRPNKPVVVQKGPKAKVAEAGLDCPQTQWSPSSGRVDIWIGRVLPTVSQCYCFGRYFHKRSQKMPTIHPEVYRAHLITFPNERQHL